MTPRLVISLEMLMSMSALLSFDRWNGREGAKTLVTGDCGDCPE